jgi:hypothetical protein
VKGKWVQDAVQRLGQWLIGGRGQDGVGRQRKASGGGACSVQHGEEEESRLGLVGQKAEQAGGAAGPTGPEAERNSFLK